MAKQFIIRSGTVSSDTILPKFNDVFPSLIAPNKRKFVDSFDGAARALAGKPLEIAPAGQAQNWAANAGLAITGDGALKPTSVDLAGDLRSMISTDGAGANGEWGATFRAGNVGSFGIIIRGAVTTQDAYRAIFRPNGLLSLQAVSDTGGASSTPAETAFVYVPGTVYTMRVTASGTLINVYVDDDLMLTYNGAIREANLRVGIYMRNTDVECLEFVGGN